jgi:hypothetical protein
MKNQPIREGRNVIVDAKPAVIVYRGNDTYVIVRQAGRADFAIAINQLVLA